MDATPYIRQNEWLTDYVNILSKENNHYKSRFDRDKRTLIELKKILEIEGLLDTYKHLFEDRDSSIINCGYPRNNYSGLNSLRARLKNRKWDGVSPFGRIESISDSDCLVSENRNILAADTTILMYTDNQCIGSPVYFFFALNSDRLLMPRKC